MNIAAICKGKETIYRLQNVDIPNSVKDTKTKIEVSLECIERLLREEGRVEKYLDIDCFGYYITFGLKKENSVCSVVVYNQNPSLSTVKNFLEKLHAENPKTFLEKYCLENPPKPTFFYKI